MSICSSFLSSRTSLLPSLLVNLPSRRPDIRTNDERDRERENRYGGREQKRGSRVEWKRGGSIYRLLSIDAPGITFVRFAGVDDVVAHGVGVISTREGTYLQITVSLAPSSLRARMYTRIYSLLFSLLLPLFPQRRAFHTVSLLFLPPIFSFFRIRSPQILPGSSASTSHFVARSIFTFSERNRS